MAVQAFTLSKNRNRHDLSLMPLDSDINMPASASVDHRHLSMSLFCLCCFLDFLLILTAVPRSRGQVPTLPIPPGSTSTPTPAQCMPVQLRSVLCFGARAYTQIGLCVKQTAEYLLLCGASREPPHQAVDLWAAQYDQTKAANRSVTPSFSSRSNRTCGFLAEADHDSCLIAIKVPGESDHHSCAKAISDRGVQER